MKNIAHDTVATAVSISQERNDSLPPYVSLQKANFDETFEGEPSKRVSAVQSYFRDKKFDGSTSQSILRVIRDYELCSKQIRLTKQQRADFFIIIFSGPAREFSFDNCRDERAFPQSAEYLIREYDSDARRLTVQSQLETMTIESFMSEREISDDTAGLKTMWTI